jgi:hypothetical protein
VDNIRELRANAAALLSAAALDLSKRMKQKKSTLDFLFPELFSISDFFLIRRLYRARKSYDCACRAVDAVEKHHPFSYLLDEVQDFMAESERLRRDRRRERQDQSSTTEELLKSIMDEIRSMRDKIDPPRPTSLDAMNARRALNALHDEKPEPQ